MENKKHNNDWDDIEWNDSEDTISFAEILHIVKRLLPYIIICSVLGIVLSWYYYKSQEPQYIVKSKILIKDENGGGAPGGQNADMFQSLGLLTGTSSVDNELEIVTAYSILEKVISDLQLNVSLKKKQFFNTRAQKTYAVPWKVKIVKYNDKAFDEQTSYTYTLHTENGKIWYEHLDKKIYITENTQISFPFGILVLEKNPIEKVEDAEWDLGILKPSRSLENYSKAIKPSIPNKNTSIINIEMQTPNPEQGKKVINKLIDTYIKEGVKDNNSINDSTLYFINDRLANVTKELQDVEGSIQNFKQKNNLTDIDGQVTMLLEVLKDNSQKLVDSEVQLNVITSLENHLKSGTYHVIPASLLTPDASLSAIINQYNLLVVQREKLSKSATPDNPTIKGLNNQISTVRNELLGSIASTRRSYAIVTDKMRSETDQNLSKVRQMPRQEREFLDISRQQAIKQELYLFLLKKREETELGKSSTLSNTRVIDYARINDTPVSPNRNMILLGGLLAGVLLPFVVYFIRKKTNTTLQTKKEISKATQMSIIGEIGHQQNSNGVFEVKNNPRSALAEQFRMLRTNLHFYQNPSSATSIMVTSSMPGEGKTFLSLNLAASLAANNQVSVLLIGFDLRKPQLAHELNLKDSKGFTNYVINDATLEEIIYDLDGFSNLKVIPSGSIPPNPSELLMSKECDQMFEIIKKRFDFIIIDCPPTVVTDYQIISKQADVTLFTVRVNYTNIKQVEIANDLYHSHKLPKMNIVVNDFDPERYDSYNSGYYYQYGYYETEYQKPPLWKRWFKL